MTPLWTPEALHAVTGWSLERCAGYAAGTTDVLLGAPMDALAAFPWLKDALAAGQKVNEADIADAAERRALGYWQATQWLPLYAGQHEHAVASADPETLRSYAAPLWEQDQDLCGMPPEEADWAFDPAFDVSRVVHLMEGGADGWRRWLAAENKKALDDRREGAAELLLQPIKEPVVIGLVDQDDLRVWHGWRRIAATIVKGDVTIAAVVGERKPEFLPSARLSA